MLRSIFAAIASSFGAFARLFGIIFMAPFRLIDRVLVGGDDGSPHEIPQVQPPDPVDGFDRQACYAEVANRIMVWAADSIVADRPVALEARDIPRDVREWLPGLTRADCVAIISADEKGVSAHLQRLFALPGVRPVQRLPVLSKWEAEPSASLEFDEGSPSFVSYADGGWPARSRARARTLQS
jgi:hypothetical protein